MLKIVTLFAACFWISGCATVTRGTTDQIQIVSDPSGADVRTSLGQQCVSPCTLQVSRKDEFTVTYSKPGYETANVDVRTQIAGSGAAGFAGNLILGGVIGMGVDAATGSTLEHVPNPVRVTLRPESRVPATPVRPARPNRPLARTTPQAKYPAVALKLATDA